jgi:hypothetical protein
MKSKWNGNGRKRKRDEDGEAQDRHHLSAQSLVQQVTYNVIAVEIMLTCQLSAGVGTSRASRRDYNYPSLWQL